jgi:predicted acyl esterase
VEVTGPIELRLFVTGKLVDVHPDGRAIALTDGILQARYRTSGDAMLVRSVPLTTTSIWSNHAACSSP